MIYRIRPAAAVPSLNADWNDPAWASAETLAVGHYRPESSAHRPATAAKLLWEPQGLHGIYRVEDRYVRVTRTEYMQDVWKDSCVEFFVQPRAGGSYCNFEFNAGGAHLCLHIRNWTRGKTDLFEDFTRIAPETGKLVRVKTSLPAVIDPEIATPVTWTLQFFLPFALLEKVYGPLGPVAGQTWRANFYKCADETSQPHWGSWSPVDELNFHLPRCFGEIEFVRP